MKRVGGVGRSGAGAVLLARRAESLQQPHGRRRGREAGESMRWGVVKALLQRCNGFAAHSGKIEDRDEGRSLAAAEFQYEHSNSSKIKAGRAKHVKKQTQTHTRSG